MTRIFALLIVLLALGCGSDSSSGGSGRAGGANLTLSVGQKYTGTYKVAPTCPGWLSLELDQAGACTWNMGWTMCLPSYAKGSCVVNGPEIIFHLAAPNQKENWKTFRIESSDPIVLIQSGDDQRVELRKTDNP